MTTPDAGAVTGGSMLEMWTETAAGAAVGEVPVNALSVQPAAAEQQTARVRTG
ncbi:MAG: hypothetical protein ACPIOQ_36230 [Promethearchaeia archaeon]